MNLKHPLEPHPISELLPRPAAITYLSMRADIELNGQAEQIILHDGMILDGFTRYQIARELGRETREELYTTYQDYCREHRIETTPLRLFKTLNVERRHLTEAQLAMFAADMPKFLHGGNRNSSPDDLKTQAQRAEFVGVGKMTVERADLVVAKGVPELQSLVRSGELAVKPAAELAKLPPEQQRAEIAKGVNKLPTAAKRARREERAGELAKKQNKLPNNQFGAIVIDPAWPFEVWDEDTGNDRAPDYPTMSLEEIGALPIPKILAPGGVVLLWATIPHLVNACRILTEDWALRYAAHLIWIKPRLDRGYWVRGKHELLLIGVREGAICPAPGTQWQSYFEAPPLEPGRNSSKPISAHEFIEQFWPDARKLEMFARTHRVGWTAWGNEA